MKNDKFNQIIANRIIELQEKYNLKMEQLAYRSGISKGGLSEIERGLKEPKAFTILKICCGLGISVSEFYDFKELKSFCDSL